MKSKSVVRNVFLLFVVVFCLINCTDYMLYVSPGNFYQLGELSVDLISISDDIAPVELDIYTPTQPGRYPVTVFSARFWGLY